MINVSQYFGILTTVLVAVMYIIMLILMSKILFDPYLTWPARVGLIVIMLVLTAGFLFQLGVFV